MNTFRQPGQFKVVYLKDNKPKSCPHMHSTLEDAKACWRQMQLADGVSRCWIEGERTNGR